MLYEAKFILSLPGIILVPDRVWSNTFADFLAFLLYFK